MLNQPEGAEWEKSQRLLSVKLQCVCLELEIDEWRGSGGWLGLLVGGRCHASSPRKVSDRGWATRLSLWSKTISWEMCCWWSCFYSWISKKIASYRYYAAGIFKMKPCSEPGGGGWRLCSGPGSVCQRGLCWLQWGLRQVRGERWTWALLGKVVSIVKRRHQELLEQLQVWSGQKCNSWGTAERVLGVELCCGSEWGTLWWVTARE